MNLITIKQLVDEGIKRGYVSSIENFTCYDCPHALPKDKTGNICEFAWDYYNTNGDCLAEK